MNPNGHISQLKIKTKKTGKKSSASYKLQQLLNVARSGYIRTLGFIDILALTEAIRCKNQCVKGTESLHLIIFTELVYRLSYYSETELQLNKVVSILVFFVIRLDKYIPKTSGYLGPQSNTLLHFATLLALKLTDTPCDGDTLQIGRVELEKTDMMLYMHGNSRLTSVKTAFSQKCRLINIGKQIAEILNVSISILKSKTGQTSDMYRYSSIHAAKCFARTTIPSEKQAALNLHTVMTTGTANNAINMIEQMCRSSVGKTALRYIIGGKY